MPVDLISTVLVIYFLLIPFIYTGMWQDTLGGDYGGKPFFKWYFTKSQRINWLGYTIFLIIGSGSFIYYIFYFLAYILFYAIFLPVCWLFEFLFLNKDCSHVVCEDLKKRKYR